MQSPISPFSLIPTLPSPTCVLRLPRKPHSLSWASVLFLSKARNFQRPNQQQDGGAWGTRQGKATCLEDSCMMPSHTAVHPCTHMQCTHMHPRTQACTTHTHSRPPIAQPNRKRRKKMENKQGGEKIHLPPPPAEPLAHVASALLSLWCPV